MSLTDNHTFKAFKEALEHADIPLSPLQVLQQSYLLSCSPGSHSYLLAGKIISLELSDTGGLEFFISSPYLGSDRIRSIARYRGAWEVRSERGEVFPAEFELV